MAAPLAGNGGRVNRPCDSRRVKHRIKARRKLLDGADVVDDPLSYFDPKPQIEHKLTQRIAAEAVARYRAEEEESEEETLCSIDEFLEGMRQRRLANEAFLAEQAAANEATERARAEATARRPSAGEADEDGEPDEQIN
jgi:hypothetical protein